MINIRLVLVRLFPQEWPKIGRGTAKKELKKDCNYMPIILLVLCLLTRKKLYLQVYLGESVYKTVEKQTMRYLDYDFIESDDGN